MATVYTHLPLPERILSFADERIGEIKEELDKLMGERGLLRAILNQRACQSDHAIEVILSDRLIAIETELTVLGRELGGWQKIRRAQGKNCVTCNGYGKLTRHDCQDQSTTIICGDCGGTGIAPKQ